ncbi:uncharacterized protein LOC105690015 [Athalia rosae]|uniref:uncharacterized protein LOC105690015 n=1 Tax=Athalia rosae TaxID=37344 RepID=UPI0020336DF4|nr:uncharacterized protein LOC105690015 [Athalia rosae]
MVEKIESPYLEALRSVAGDTPGEKQKTINEIAKKLATVESGGIVDPEVPDIPELLRPLVRVEVAKILHRYDEIIEALKSEDLSVVTRALQAKWFFDGSEDAPVNAKYFADKVFHEISLFARLKVIKNLGLYLKNPRIAADFFTATCELYGVEQALPLLPACGEDFAFQNIMEKKILLSSRMVRTLYRKYPKLVIKYLMQSERQSENIRTRDKIKLSAYADFYSEISNEHFEEFMKICSIEKSLKVKLGKRASKTLVKKRPDLVVDNPKKYLEIVPLKLLAQKLSSDDFKKMFKNLFPEDKNDFDYAKLMDCSKFLKNDEDKVKLIRDTFREVYGEDVIHCKNLINRKLMQSLPPTDRIKVARMRLEEDKDWHVYDPEYSWRCYLPTEESIPAIIREIAKTSDATQRGEFLKHLIFTCRVNDDREALIKVLKYVYDRHKNDQKYIIQKFLSSLQKSFALSKLTSAHWEILNNFIKRAEIVNDFDNAIQTYLNLLESAIGYCELNDLPADDYVRTFVSRKISWCYQRWNILRDNADLERKYLKIFIDALPEQYPFDDEVWKKDETVRCIAWSLWEFNERHAPPNGGEKKFSVADYPWILEKLEEFMEEKLDERYLQKSMLAEQKKNEPEIYVRWIKRLKNFWEFGEDVISDVFKETPERVLANYKECFKELSDVYQLGPKLTRIIVKSKSYRELGIKFYGEALENYANPEKSKITIAILALLTDGETFAKIIESHVPTEDTIDIEDPGARDKYKLVPVITSNLGKVNPPVSLEIVGNFCAGDYLQLALCSLSKISCKIPVSKVIGFAAALTDGKVSAIKQGIRMIYEVGTREEVDARLGELWNLQKHASVRGVLFKKIFHAFSRRPDPRSWALLKGCLDGLNAADEAEVFKILETQIYAVPKDYLRDYVAAALGALKMMEEKAEDPDTYVDRACDLLKAIDPHMAEALPEEFCRNLMRRYLFVFQFNNVVFEAGRDFAINCYLLGSKSYDESRLNFFLGYLRDSINEHWDEPAPKRTKFFPMNFMVNQFLTYLCDQADRTCDVRIFESFLGIFKTVLKPHQEPVSFTELFYFVDYRNSESPREFGEIVARHLPELVGYFSPECVISLSNRLSEFLGKHNWKDFANNEENALMVIDRLAETGDIRCSFFAANMLSGNTAKKFDGYRNRVIQNLYKLEHPGISAILNERLRSGVFPGDVDE